MTIPHYDPIIPLPGRIIKEMAPLLDISASLLYLLVRKGHQPSPYTIRRITKATGLPDTIWELPRHETITRIIEALNSHRASSQEDLEELF